jgi:eukaryotic-like serine/threonine-protein kinase
MGETPASDEGWPPGYELGRTLVTYGATTVREGRCGERAVLVKTARSGVRHLQTTASTLDREARIVAEIDHPTLPPVIDVVRDGVRVALIFPNHRGHRLDAVLDRVGRLPVDAALAIAVDLAGALAAIHRAGHAHGLLRPSLVEVDEHGHVYLHATGQLPRGAERGRDELLELPEHMAPEMVLGDEPDPASDVFLFGLLIFQCLTGEHPFSGDEAGITQRIRHAPTPRLRRLAPEVPAEVDRIVHRCLEKRPRDRFEDLATVQSLLVRALRDRTSLPRELILGRTLSEAGLADELAPPRERHLDRSGMLTRPGIRRGLVGAAGAIVALVLASLWVHFDGDDDDGTAAKDARGIVGSPARLRVLAHPWAEIYVDGEAVDTTPVGRLIEVSPGRHEVVFRHPHAPDEKRVVEIIAGQIIVLDVTMQIVRPVETAAPEEDASAEDSTP